MLAVSALLLVLISSAEAGIIAISRSRVRAHGEEGLPGLLERYIRQRQHFLRALSVGTTTTTVAATVALLALLLGDRATSPRALLGGAVLAVLGVAFLRQTARTVALLNPEAVGLRMARPIALLRVVFTPLGWLAGLPAQLMVRLVGHRVAGPPDPAEELLAVLRTPLDADAGAALSEERRMMRGILAMPGQTVRELMSPRIDITAVSTDASVGDVLRLITESGFSRIPLYEDSIDHIVGVIYAKDLLAYLRIGNLTPDLLQVARPPYFVPETKRADELLTDLRNDQVHMAVAVDEYGGTAGVVTVEDLIEEIVGEIVDEYDTEEVDVQQVSAEEAVVDARLPIDELNELFGTTIGSEDFDTVGGLIFSLLGRLAVPGDRVESEQHQLRLNVLSILGRRIKKVRVSRMEPAEERVQAV